MELPEDAHFAMYAKNHLLNEFYIDYSHSTPCWKDIFELGLLGLLERVKANRKKHSLLTKEQEAYHNYAGSKYTALHIENKLPSQLPTDKELTEAQNTVRQITNFEC